MLRILSLLNGRGLTDDERNAVLIDLLCESNIYKYTHTHTYKYTYVSIIAYFNNCMLLSLKDAYSNSSIQTGTKTVYKWIFVSRY